MPGCYNETSDVIMGTKGRAILPSKPRIEGQTTWRYSGSKPSMYDVEHQEFFDAIRSGKTINNGDYMATSTMLGILAQMVCYTGQQITWEKAMTSKLNFSLDRYDWDATPPVMPDQNGQYPTAMPGLTKFA
jgi:myo-inositol 2-dehydrogenase / D-chiro-inositol 1-dehydrogenase